MKLPMMNQLRERKNELVRETRVILVKGDTTTTRTSGEREEKYKPLAHIELCVIKLKM